MGLAAWLWGNRPVQSSISSSTTQPILLCSWLLLLPPALPVISIHLLATAAPQPMSKPSTSRSDNFVPAMQLLGDDVLYLCSADWVAGLGLGSAYANSMAMSLTPSLHSTSHLTPLTPQAQSLPLDMYPDMPELTFKHGHYLTVDSQLPRSAESLMVPPLYHDVSSQESNSSYSPPEARLPSESPSFQDTDTTPSAEAPKKPRRSRPNRYKNAAPAVIQRRRAANRKSQQAYRKRKDDRIAELEELLDQAAQRAHDMDRAYVRLRAEYEQLLVIGGAEAAGHPSSVASTGAEEKAFLALASFAQPPSDHGLSHPPHPQQATSVYHVTGSHDARLG
ncbi:hypothetical protein CCM_08379 [Cordyceps militaris CM01]|uniref:BZIP domain-containing protein n=1 Tax=Cordyceps militaris (strain CM01) TaxID=983644 RepID=G3JR40_CORMM|nr:uncharacterized protein CCM_08379 [Cordyceps militaris CM01]EGX88336.1 hypothetical protein CCM_08379 [Cordyceps militaris CM01]